jgi:hypothetical protein
MVAVLAISTVALTLGIPGAEFKWGDYRIEVSGALLLVPATAHAAYPRVPPVAAAPYYSVTTTAQPTLRRPIPCSRRVWTTKAAACLTRRWAC